MKPIVLTLSWAALAAVVALSAGSLGGCERQLFKDTDTINDRRVSYFSNYDGETVKAANERRKQSREWGLGLPGSMSSNGE